MSGPRPRAGRWRRSPARRARGRSWSEKQLEERLRRPRIRFIIRIASNCYSGAHAGNQDQKDGTRTPDSTGPGGGADWSRDIRKWTYDVVEPNTGAFRKE